MKSERSLESLLSEASLGRESAFSEFVLRTQAALGLYISQTSGRPNVADLMQETYLSLWRSLATYQPNRSAMTWLFSIARNRSIDEYRRSIRRPPQVNIDSIGSAHPYLDGPESFFPGDLQAALRDLDPTARDVFVLCAVIGFSYSQVAEIVGIPLGTVRSKLHHTRQILATAITMQDQSVKRA